MSRKPHSGGTRFGGMPENSLIEDAAAWLAGRVRRTPLIESPGLGERLGRPVRLKMESLQITGSFKVRGALNALRGLAGRDAGGNGGGASGLAGAGPVGVTTCSAGNHGLGIAWAARSLGLSATIFVPSSVDAAKLDGMLRLGATVVRTPFPGFDDSEAWALERAAESGLTWVSAYDDELVMAGNGGSIAVEILDQCPDVDTIVVPVGGGGMAGGIASALAERRPGVKLVAAQLAASAALKASLDAGHAVTRMPPAETLAAGLEGGLGMLPFEALKGRVHRVDLATEAQVWESVRWMLKRHGQLVEPSAAVAIASCLHGDWEAGDGPVVVIVSGRNVAASAVHRIMNGEHLADPAHRA